LVVADNDAIAGLDAFGEATLSLFADLWRDEEHDAMFRLETLGKVDPFFRELEGACHCPDGVGRYSPSFTVYMWLHVIVKTDSALKHSYEVVLKRHQDNPKYFPEIPDPDRYVPGNVLEHELGHVRADFATAESFAATLDAVERTTYSEVDCQNAVDTARRNWADRLKALDAEQVPTPHPVGWDWYVPKSDQANKIIDHLKEWFEGGTDGT
jgi:hypothetical protein